MIGIYKITNNITGLSYIGKSRNIEKRFKKHEYCSHDKNFHKPLYDDMRKYGIENFDFSILKETNTYEECTNLETYYIDLYNTIIPNGYNKSRGPGALSVKIEHTDKELWIKHLSESHKGNSSWIKGKHHSEESRIKLSKYFKGKPNIKNRGEGNGMYGKEPWNKGTKGVCKSSLKGMHWYKDPITNKHIYY